MPSLTVAAFNPLISIGGPVGEFIFSDIDDFLWENPDATGSNESVTLDGGSVDINSVQHGLGLAVVIATLPGGGTVNLSLDVYRVAVDNPFPLPDSTYIIFPDLPPGVTSITVLSLPLFGSNTVMPLCFSGDARILTEGGHRLARDIQPGDMVMTRDHGAQKVLWVGRREIDFDLEPEMSEHRPILFEPGSVDGVYPTAPLRLSPQHRILVTGWRAELYFGASSILVPAKALVNDQTVRVDTKCRSVDYIHLLFLGHEVVWAEDLPVESLFLGEIARGIAGEALQREVFEIFPELREVAEWMKVARPAIRVADGRVLSLQ